MPAGMVPPVLVSVAPPSALLHCPAVHASYPLSVTWMEVPLVMSLKQTKLISSWEDGVMVELTPTIAKSPLFNVVCASATNPINSKTISTTILFINYN